MRLRRERSVEKRIHAFFAVRAANGGVVRLRAAAKILASAVAEPFFLAIVDPTVAALLLGLVLLNLLLLLFLLVNCISNRLEQLCVYRHSTYQRYCQKEINLAHNSNYFGDYYSNRLQKYKKILIYPKKIVILWPIYVF